MARARGANAQLCLAYETNYGTPPGSGYIKMPFVSSDLGEQQNLITSDVLGYGRDPQDPVLDVINNEGNVAVPLDLRSTGDWLKLMMGAPTTTQGLAATGSYLFSAQPVNNSILTVNGQAITFVTGTPIANQVKIGTTLSDTIANAVIALNASVVAGVAAATYSADLAGTTILIVHDTIGVAGNAFTIVAGSAPATNATASGATLTGGAATGPYNNVFVSGATSLPSVSIEVGLVEVPSYGMNYGCMLNSFRVQLQRSGLLGAQLGLICQGEARAATTGAGAPTTRVFERFTQFTGQIARDGVPLANIVSGSLQYSNGLDKIEVIRSDGRIGGSDAAEIAVTGDIVLRFADTMLLNLAINNTPLELRFNWQIAAQKSLLMVVHRVLLPKPKLPITGPNGVQATFNFQAAKDPVLAKTCTMTLVNDVNGY